MRNMKPFDLKDAFEVYKEAVNRKQTGEDKSELQSIETQIGDCYANYDWHFNQNDLEYIPRARVGELHKDVLLGLYSSQAKIIKDFRKRYFDINPQTYNNLCPYCVINSSNTTEHILPKDTYPEYAVHVKNLIPGCSECNTYKGEDVLDKQGKKITINYYTDILPDEQFLFVDISLCGSSLTFDYRLSNDAGRIDANLFALIERHFTKMHLIDRYKDKAIQEFAEIKNMYLAEEFIDDIQYQAFAAKQIKKCDLDVKEYGRNHWKVVLLRACAESDVFKQFILSC